jgi:DNA-binding response OmpR family regulator
MSNEPKPAVGTAKRILVVDDERTILFAIRSYFNRYGYEVDCARELEEAEALLSHRQYDIVIADLRLTGSSGREGLDVVRFIRERCPGSPIVMMTAYGTPEIELEAVELGARAFLQKPKPLAELAEVVFSLVGAPA